MHQRKTTYQKLRTLKREIETLGELHHYLRVAMEVELSTIPAYLCALYSIKPGTNSDASSLIRSVVIEEMLHLTLAANVLNATGGTSMLNEPDFVPHYPTQLPASNIDEESGGHFMVPLQGFCPNALEVFLRIEQPEPTGAPPEVEGWQSIGQFYDGLAKGLRNLCDSLGTAAVFTGKVKDQVRPEDYYGGAGEVIIVADPDPDKALQNALKAFEEIVEQGEGMEVKVFDGDTVPGKDGTEHPVPAHFFRFQEIQKQQYYKPGDKPGYPTGPRLEVDWDGAYPMQQNPSMNHYPEGSEIGASLHDFNSVYMQLLGRLQAAFSGDPKQLMAAVGVMYDLKYKAQALMRIPTGDGKTTVGPSFEYIPPSS